MRKLLLLILCIGLLAGSVQALEAPPVPSSGYEWMPRQQGSFGQGILEMLRDVLAALRPDLAQAAKACMGVLAAVLILSVVQSLSEAASKAADLAAAVLISGILLQSTNALIQLGTLTVREMIDYGKLLLPVMTTALAAQGAVASSGALYAGTMAFNVFLGSLIEKVLTPAVYLFLVLSIAGSAVGDGWIRQLQQTQSRWMQWCLRTILYIFTGYIAITGVVSGNTDAAALKAAKLTISGAVPVVGNILSDASEAVLVSAGLVKNSIGLYGLLAVLAVWIHPFLKIGSHYLLLKGTCILCGIFGDKRICQLVGDFSAAMGIVLAMTGTSCLLLMISTVCFMKGVG